MFASNRSKNYRKPVDATVCTENVKIFRKLFRAQLAL